MRNIAFSEREVFWIILGATVKTVPGAMSGKGLMLMQERDSGLYPEIVGKWVDREKGDRNTQSNSDCKLCQGEPKSQPRMGKIREQSRE